MRPACVFFRASVRNVLISVDVHERRFTDCLAIKITPDFLLRAPYTQVGVQMPTENAHEKTMYSDEKLKIECANKKGDRSRPANKKHRPRGSTTGRAKSDVESIRRAFWGVQPSRRGAIVLRPRNVRHQTKKVARKPPPKMKSPGQTGPGLSHDAMLVTRLFRPKARRESNHQRDARTELSSDGCAARSLGARS
jgi:hypothetical protein